ncbi:MAG: hypothetical protein R2851_13820 [Caldilineaceae bacterium]
MEEAGDSFGQYMLPMMTLALKQGFGRLIRRSSDCGCGHPGRTADQQGYGRQVRQDAAGALQPYLPRRPQVLPGCVGPVRRVCR